MDGERRVADYFIISGLSDKFEEYGETRPLINSELPITDITVIFKGLGEQCPIGYECIEATPGGYVADLNNGNFKSPNIHICFRRGDDKPPLIEVGVFHEDKDRILPDIEVISKTPYGRSASTGNSNSKSGTYITYRRSKIRRPYNQLVVVDLCVILNNKSENAPHAFYTVKKNLNKSYYGMIGSEVFLCYKKSFLSPPAICYTPQIVSRFPLQDYANFPLPNTVPLFCLPAGANIELRPTNANLPRPVCSTFVLTSDSAQKIYGSALTFYEPFDQSLLTEDQRSRLGISNHEDDRTVPDTSSDNSSSIQQPCRTFDTYATKSICILSRWPFFECFERFLLFLHKLVFWPMMPTSNLNSPMHRSDISLEHHISHFLLDVSFPTPQRPSVMVQLTSGTDETITISQPSSRLPLPLTGASFIQLLSILGVENSMNVLLYGLSEQKILLHSLNPWVLTGVAEAIIAMLFPFHWQCPYVPLCPISLHGIINAPLPFIVGIDSRCFDTFTPPDDVICVNLDTQSIFLSDAKKNLNSRILPKRAARVLRSSLDKIYQKWVRISQAIGANQSPQHRSPVIDKNRRLLEKRLELEIQEAFVRFMAMILRGFRSYLLPITSAPTVGATDPTSLFNFDGFLSSRDRSHSQFYQLITRTQMFTHYIEARSFVSDKNTSLAFFDDCEEKLTSSDDIFSDRPIKLFDKDDGIIPTDRSVYIPAPEQSPSIANNIDSVNLDGIYSPQQTSLNRTSLVRSCRFGPLDSSKFHRHPMTCNLMPFNRAMSNQNGNTLGVGNSNSFEQSLFKESIANDLNNAFSISRRTKQEVRACQKLARKSSDNPLDWAKYLVSCSYCLWFSTLPSYVSYCKNQNKEKNQATESEEEISKATARILRYAFTIIVRMQKLQLTTDEICFRILTLLCGYHGQPALAVRVFFEMKKAGIKPNAVTYGYYNKAVLESRWPDHSSKPTTVLWTKIRNVISGIALFKSHGRMRKERRAKRPIQFVADPSFCSYQSVDVVDRASSPVNQDPSELFRTTTMPLKREHPFESDGKCAAANSRLNTHRRSLVNRSFSTNQKSNPIISDPAYESFTEAPKIYSASNAIHKSYSMYLRNDTSPEHDSLVRMNSSSLDDDDIESDDEPLVVQKLINQQSEGACMSSNTLSQKKITSTQDLFLTLLQRHQLLVESVGDEKTWSKDLDLSDNSAGLLFTTTPEICRQVVTRSVSQSLIEIGDEDNQAPLSGKPTNVNQYRANQSDLILMDSNLVEVTQKNSNVALLNASSFGEDAQILRKLEKTEQRPDLSNSLDNFGLASLVKSCASGNLNDDYATMNDNRSGDRLSESTADQSESNPSNEEDSVSLRNITSTPNFKLASLINDASNLQWSKWTSSQNSKSVYKGIKSAATGFVSQLQEIKSSFSMTTGATPSKLLNTAQHKSTTTREMLSQWANFFTYQPSRNEADDSDASSDCSNDLLRLSNEEDVEPSSTEASDFRACHQLFETLEKHFSNNSFKDDLIHYVSSNDEVNENQVAIEIKITTCSRCNICHSLLYDEEIMERWSHHESNLNTKCIYCRAKIVPLMSIEVSDFRFAAKLKQEESKPCVGRSAVTDDLVDLNFEDSEAESDLSLKKSINGCADDSKNCDSHKRASQSSSAANQQTFTVPYLSPIVLRKELESVFESSGDNCPASSRFIDEHPIIYWNLLWYFSRINAPTHLARLCLESKSILNGRDIPAETNLQCEVVVRTRWDNEKLNAQIGKPLYRLLERAEPSLEVEAILCDDLHFTKKFLEKVIGLIRSNELRKAMVLVLNARLKSSSRFSFDRNRHNLYRDLLFLINTYFGPGKLYIHNFEREYKRAFESLSFQHVALNRFDRPPTIGSLYCRKCFKEPSLVKRA